MLLPCIHPSCPVLFFGIAPYFVPAATSSFFLQTSAYPPTAAVLNVVARILYSQLLTTWPKAKDGKKTHICLNSPRCLPTKENGSSKLFQTCAIASGPRPRRALQPHIPPHLPALQPPQDPASQSRRIDNDRNQPKSQPPPRRQLRGRR